MAAPGLRPAMVATPWSPDSCCDHLLAGAEPVHLAPPSVHAPCTGLMDPLGIFTVFAAIPLVFLIDHRKLGERSAPRRWSDLLEPGLRGDVVFGGWRPHAGVPFTDYNQFLLLCLLEEFGADGIRAFAASVKGLQHNVVSARTAGADNAPGGAVAVLPWMQAEMAPRRAQVSVVWPDDGAYAMPIGFVARPNRLGRVRPLVETLIGTELGGVLARNCYPPANGAVAGAFPPGAGLKWPGWERVREGGMTAQAERAGRLFFDAWGG
ncbi:MAG: ABC transporter substrate-binding protein [Magnetospirillum sp.]|nr:ABC transporter substrate-binding protein [Magnetospirillum sp.]